jgi:hypothetical protein
VSVADRGDLQQRYLDVFIAGVGWLGRGQRGSFASLQKRLALVCGTRPLLDFGFMATEVYDRELEAVDSLVNLVGIIGPPNQANRWVVFIAVGTRSWREACQVILASNHDVTEQMAQVMLVLSGLPHYRREEALAWLNWRATTDVSHEGAVSTA